MLINWLLILGGLFLLVTGAEALVRGAGGIALMAKISPSVVALTVVAAGTSMPELVVSLKAALEGSPGLSLGNAVGSNMLNIGLVMGLTALIRPLKISRITLRFEWPVMMLAVVQFALLSRDGTIDRVEGFFFVAAIVAFMTYAVLIDKKGLAEIAPKAPLSTASFGKTGGIAVLFNSLSLLVGIGLLAQGSNLLVKGAVAIASGLGISDTIIGLSVIAVGTSAPELVTSLVAASRGRGDMAVGNIIGSCIFNLLGILGITALIAPLSVPNEIIMRDTFWLIAITAILFPMILSGKTLARLEGSLLLGVFLAYTGLLIAGTT